MAEIITKDLLLDRKVQQGYTENAPLFLGDRIGNANAAAPEIVPGSERQITISSKQYTNSEAQVQLWKEIADGLRKAKQMAANFPEDDYYTLIDKIRVDLTRRRMEEVDYSGMMCQEVTNFGFSRSISLDEFLPFAAPFSEFGAENDSLNLIQQKTGQTSTVTMVPYGVGWKTSLQNILYNQDIFSLQKVLEAVSRGYVSLRNNLTVGQMVAKTTAGTWAASQQQAADATAGASKDELLYNTLNAALNLLISLKDPQTGQEISTPRIALLCRPTDVRRINRAINGQLNVAGKRTTANFEALNEIAEIWPYRGDTIYFGKNKISYPGVASVKAYLFVPQEAAFCLVKRPLTQEIGSGSVLSLSQEERAWYFVQTTYLGEFFGSSDATVFAKVGADHGYVVEVTLPAA